MKNVRIELKLTVIAYAGEDVGEEHMADSREPDAVECITLATVRPLATNPIYCAAHQAAGGLLAQMLANTAPIVGSRLNHTLRKKGL